MAKKKKWIQAASASIKKRGTEGVCTGPKFGGPTCPPGSKRYNLAKVFKGMAKKKKKAAWGSMIHAKDSKYIQTREHAKKMELLFKKYAVPRKKATGAMIHAKTSTFAETHASNWAKRRAASTTGMTLPANLAKATKGTTGMAKLVKNLKKVIGVFPTVAGASKFKGADPSKYLSRAKTLTKVGGRRSLMLMGGPMGAAAAAATLTPSLINKLTKRAPGAKKTKLFGIDIKGAEKSARSREALMAKRNKARNAKTGAMIKATHGIEVLGKQSVPFESQGATANLAAERQGRKGAAVRGFNFKGVF